MVLEIMANYLNQYQCKILRKIPRGIFKITKNKSLENPWSIVKQYLGKLLKGFHGIPFELKRLKVDSKGFLVQHLKSF